MIRSESVPFYSRAALVGAGFATPTARHPYAVVVDSRDRVFIADGASRRILRLDPSTGRLRSPRDGTRRADRSCHGRRRSLRRRLPRRPRQTCEQDGSSHDACPPAGGDRRCGDSVEHRLMRSRWTERSRDLACRRLTTGFESLGGLDRPMGSRSTSGAGYWSPRTRARAPHRSDYRSRRAGHRPRGHEQDRSRPRRNAVSRRLDAERRQSPPTRSRGRPSILLDRSPCQRCRVAGQRKPRHHRCGAWRRLSGQCAHRPRTKLTG